MMSSGMFRAAIAAAVAVGYAQAYGQAAQSGAAVGLLERRVALDGERVAAEEWIAMNWRIRDVLQAPDGAILMLVDDRKGDLLRVTPVRNAQGQPTR